MNYELYEVWGVDEDGHEELIETTASKKEANIIAENSLTTGFVQAVIYREDDHGDLEEVDRIELG
jgi:hypothetical protein